jgi:diguanylate cyclase (GGDEF)-like protein/putative nucleotidyltransferase with HDIG domain
MRAGPDAFEADPVGFRFRLRNVQAGVWLSVCCCLFYTAYSALTWSQGGRTTVLALAAVALAASLTLSRLPLDRLLHRPVLREVFFLGWSGLLVALLALAAAADGGAGSPLAGALVLPVIFGALSYPAGSMVVVGSMAVLAYLGLVVAVGGAATADAFFTSMVLVCGSVMCAWQARNQQLQRLELARVSRSDPLTGALNRRGFEERFGAELHRSERTGQPLGYILVDLDSFKELNDLQGHAAGDEMLRWVVETLLAALRPMDVVGRLGGDEFAVLVPGAGDRATRAVAERLRDALAMRAPCSLGTAAFPADGTEPGELHGRADVRLYEAKHGRSAAHVPSRRRELSWAAALARAVDLRMASGHAHSTAVGELTAHMARRLGWDEQRVAQLRLAAILHDVGKVAVPDSILRKPGRLDEHELAIVRTHSSVGADMVLRIEGLEAIAPWIRHSHEHVDGSGYPRGLRGDAIPVESRLILVADAFDAMTSERAYRRAASPEEALAELRRCAGRQFDPDCVELLAAELAAAYGEPRAAATRAPRGSSAPRTTRQATATSAMSAKPRA